MGAHGLVDSDRILMDSDGQTKVDGQTHLGLSMPSPVSRDKQSQCQTSDFSALTFQIQMEQQQDRTPVVSLALAV